uniref:PKD/Chitinase domain-containing protein n=1 Tax=uncultured marine group II/III euryarchaeote KM3_155_G07 TaxID=1457898 RepID=A0A075GKN9_9EURY|nr:hypothetical protein [uncultured marine group II/III euryarchaeote KM3_155_G07]
MSAGAGKACGLVLLMLLSSVLWLAPPAEVAEPAVLEDLSTDSEAGSRALTIWSSTIDVNGDYTVAAGDELRILAGTIIRMGPGVRIYIEGKIVAQGTQLDPISVEVQSGFTWHDGFQFNATSRNRGSSMRNITFEDAQFGITIKDSNPVIEDAYFDNVDLVGIDLFDSASPVIRRSTFQDGGQDVHGSMTNWRYGIGLSVGAGSAPFVDDVTFDNQITRAISYWGNSGGLLRNINISNVGGATMNISAGVFIEDSRPLIEDLNISKCDNGVYILHRTDTIVTRPVIRRATIGDSQYTGIMMTKVDRFNFSTYMMARFHDIEVFGTGGPNAASPGIGIASVFLNTSGAWIENADIHDNAVNGIKLYMTDPSTTIVNATVARSGKPLGGTNDRAGVFSRSSNNGGASLQNLEVSESPGSGIFVSKGSITGSNWHSHNNSAQGLSVSELFPYVDDVLLANNGQSGLRVYDSKQVWLSNLTTRSNGFSAPSPQSGTGMVFVKSNDLMAAGNVVQCIDCTSENDNWGAIRVEDSVDLRFVDLTVRDPVLAAGQSAIVMDDSNMNWQGWIEIEGAEIYTNTTAGTPAIQLDDVDVRINGMNIHGSNGGIDWTGRSLTSSLSNSSLVGTDCLTINDIPTFESWGLDLSGCSGNFAISSSDVNLTNFVQGGVALAITGSSYIRAISSSVTIPVLPPGATLDEMWFVDLWAVNQHGHGLPYSAVNVSFSQLETDFSFTMPYGGNQVLGPFVGQRHTITGSSAVTDISTDCTYDNTSGSTGPDSLTLDLSYYLCTITLVNQPPLIIWDEPLNNTVTSSGAEIWFNASNSWDLDNDPITFQWTSDVDGDTTSFCGGFGNGVVPGDLLVNGLVGQGACILSDGEHQITLTVCDDQGNCASETRTITFVNLPPSVIVQTTPALDWDGVLRLNYTENLHVNASDTTDAEGDMIQTGEWTDYEQSGIPVATSYPLEWNRTFEFAPGREFTYTMAFSDGLNPPVYYNLSVEVQNEYPHPSFTVSRDSNLSESLVTFDGTASFDPEGDPIDSWWHSDIDGDLAAEVGNPLALQTHLSQGTHTLSLRLSDDDSYHVNQWSNPFEITLKVVNSPPRTQITLPANGTTGNSGQIIDFSAYGSGDWDAPCSEAFADMSTGWWCNPGSPATPDTVTPVWTSDLLSEPFGTDWEVQARLPAGVNVVTLTVSDGVNPVQTTSVMLDISKSAPILVLASPFDGIEVVSDEVILFDPQQSWDPDGDNFILTVTSDLLTEPILDGVSPAFWYSRYVPAGEHLLTFTLTDADNMSSSETRSIIVLASPPVAIIGSPIDGESFDPGTNVQFTGNESWDADGDIVLYRWYLGAGAGAVLLNETANANQTLPPGNHRISLQVKDTRGASGWAYANITVRSSWPIITDLIHEPARLEAGVPASVVARAFVDDADMTTWECMAWATQGGIEKEFNLNDNGTGQDSRAGDGIWEGAVTVEPGREGWMSLEVVCRDGPTDEPRLSNRLSVTIPVDGATQQASFFDVISGNAFTLILAIVALLIVSGVAMVVIRRRRLDADLAMIESWGATGFTGEDDTLFDDVPTPDEDQELPFEEEPEAEEIKGAPDLDADLDADLDMDLDVNLDTDEIEGAPDLD